MDQFSIDENFVIDLIGLGSCKFCGKKLLLVSKSNANLFENNIKYQIVPMDNGIYHCSCGELIDIPVLSMVDLKKYSSKFQKRKFSLNFQYNKISPEEILLTAIFVKIPGDNFKPPKNPELSQREREVLELRYGLLDGKSHSPEEVSNYYSIKEEQVILIEKRALYKLRHPSDLHKHKKEDK